jgi:hypothetical protein
MSLAVVLTVGLRCFIDLVDWSLNKVEDLIVFHN